MCCWTQELGRLEAGRDGLALDKRLRYHYLVVHALLVRSARRYLLKLRRDDPFIDVSWPSCIGSARLQFQLADPDPTVVRSSTRQSHPENRRVAAHDTYFSSALALPEGTLMAPGRVDNKPGS